MNSQRYPLPPFAASRLRHRTKRSSPKGLLNLEKLDAYWSKSEATWVQIVFANSSALISPLKTEVTALP